LEKCYVYEHWRLDRDECFYVGIGSNPGRAHSRHGRNRHWHAIVSKLARENSTYEVRIVESGISWDRACEIEIERIAFWRYHNIDLANICAGGRGAVGMRHSEETRKKISQSKKNPSAETRAKISASRQGFKHSEETKQKLRGKTLTEEQKAKITLSLIGNKRTLGLKLSEDTKAKLSEAKKGDKNNFYGKTHSEESRLKIKQARAKQVFTEETKEKLRAARKGRKPALGYVASPEVRIKMSEAQKKRWAQMKQTRVENG